MPLWFTGKYKPGLCLAMSLLLSLPVGFTPLARAQSTDPATPVIDLHQVQQGVAGEVQVFTVEIENPEKLASVDFMHRFAGESDYRKSPMSLLDGTSVFTAYIDTQVTESRAIEYYIQVLDSAGNRSVKGFTFEPFVRKLDPGEGISRSPVEPETAQTPTQNPAQNPGQIPGQASATAETTSVADVPVAEKSTGSSKKWLWGLAGVVVVALIASSLGSSSDDDSTDPLSLEVKHGSRMGLSW